MSGKALPAFSAYGIELEYMIVDRGTLSVKPIADALLEGLAGVPAADAEVGRLGCSNELVRHLIEIKNPTPDPTLEPLVSAFQSAITEINGRLDDLDARLMPGGMHPWMDPATETRLWPGENADIYAAFDRVFGCRAHGWANLQSMHVNLPFADDGEFARLHAAIRLVLPVLPALAASSPIVAAGNSGFLDFRMEAYRTHTIRVPSLIGSVVPEPLASRAEHERLLERMYRDIAPFDQAGLLQHEWLNARGAVPRFERMAMEIRAIDVQECPQADLGVAAATIAAVRALYEARWASLAEQRQMASEALAQLLLACIRDGDQALITDAAYLRLMGFPERSCRVRDLWRHLIETMPANERQTWQAGLALIMEQGPLACRILKAVGSDFSRTHLRSVYRELCVSLAEGRLFVV